MSYTQKGSVNNQTFEIKGKLQKEVKMVPLFADGQYDGNGKYTYRGFVRVGTKKVTLVYDNVNGDKQLIDTY